MQFARTRTRKANESTIPMINVVFLLLIFFLMTAQITPPEPFEVTPPEASVYAPATGQLVLHVSAEGEMAFGDAHGEEDVLAALDDFVEEDELMLRADRGVPADLIASLLPKLAQAGVRHLNLVSTAR
ncbi:ExbD/TolR family protein [Shimia thalassica]|uniref:ExbD/TolR family protein n=1 Tax=Shimia thalassica TaxID=1715693 RepID=UPI0026E39AD3|nr:biopolymer transporter ExbD [Shimia thalassica]MDO6800042.1 biopolymer transporter ExbD [Shimia thalassica]